MCRPAAHGQQHGVHHLAAGEHDQSEELLHVRLSFLPPSLHPIPDHHINIPVIDYLTSRLLHLAMVGRKVLDGLRKGKKDVYALNVQYVKRYQSVAPLPEASSDATLLQTTSTL